MSVVTHEGFLERAMGVHGDCYNYSKTVYINSKTPVTIVCKKHGEFVQRPSHHLDNKGCPLCGRESNGKAHKKSIEHFLEKAKEKHGQTYDYSKVVYNGSKSPVTIICKIHGEFVQRADHHWNGCGCPQCTYDGYRKLYQNSTEHFVSKSTEIHGDRYDYSLVNYVNRQTKVDIICKYHGIFSQSADTHMKGSGCPNCADSLGVWRYSEWEAAGLAATSFDGFKLYVLRCWNDSEQFFKIGKTYRTIAQRYRSKNDLPYEYEVILVKQGSARFVSELEQELINKHGALKYTPKVKFGGMEECFSAFRN